MNTFNGALAIAALAASALMTPSHASAACEPDEASSPVSGEQQQTLAARNFSNTSKFRVAEGGADRLRERQLAADGSDRLKGNHYADIGYDYGGNINAHYSMD